jgi:response regulator RpfG family c-di-GMP phosphodiesterase
MENNTYKHTILLVDDEESITKALRRLFRTTGFKIITALSGQEGLSVLEKAEEPVSLIISDQRMPEMSGARFLEKARTIFPDAIRFLLTGYSDMDAIVDAVNKGEIHRYLTKPWNDDDLIVQVKQAIKQYELVLENRRLNQLTIKQNKELSELNEDLEQKVIDRTRKIE